MDGGGEGRLLCTRVCVCVCARARACVRVHACAPIPEDSAAGLHLRELRFMSPVTSLSVFPISGLLGAQAGMQDGHVDLLSVVRGAETEWG